MYSTKSKATDRIIDIKGEREKRYITIGDPYKDVREALPSRWKKKQFDCVRRPMNAGHGFFGYNGKAFTYVPQKFQEVKLYVTDQPLAGRKLGFGMRDVMKRDEFCNSIRTEQYRDTLRAEQRIMNAQRDVDKENALVEKAQALEEATKGPERFLYDIGRSQTTVFDPKTRSDAHYNYREKYRVQKRIGATRPMSADIGAMAWSVTPESSSRAAHVHATKSFYDKSHMEVKGF